MEDHKNDNLENFFRNRAEGFQYEFREEDWARMEAKLDAANTASRFVFGRYFWMALGAIIASSLIFTYMYFQKSEKNPGLTKTSESVRPSVPGSSLGKKGNTEQATKNKTIQEKNFDNEQTEQIVISRDQRNVGNSMEQAENTISDTKPVDLKNPDDDNSAVPDVEKGQPGVFSDLYFSLGHATKKQSDSDANFAAMEQKIRDKPKGHVKTTIFKPLEAKQTEITIFSYHLIYPVVRKQYRIPFEPVFKRSFTIGITGAMDISTTPESNLGQPVMRYGIHVAYFFSDRWSIGIGANLSNKKYMALGKEYKPPKGFWTGGVVPDSTDAMCEILDVPVTVSYFMPAGKKGSVVFQAGLSSWFMLKEEYYFKYTSNDPDLVKEWYGENANRYWFGIVNMAISYEFQLSNNWSLMAGPYFNLPLTGIGHGNVKLRSFGIRTSLMLNNYKLINKK